VYRPRGEGSCQCKADDACEVKPSPNLTVTLKETDAFLKYDDTLQYDDVALENPTALAGWALLLQTLLLLVPLAEVRPAPTLP
jgi:hypothetical protein